MTRLDPVYIDGPLKGQRFDTPDQVPVVYAMGSDGLSILNDPAEFVYRLTRVAFRMGGKAVAVWVAWCSGDREPDAETVCRALFRDDVMERTQVVVMSLDPAL